MVTAAIIIGLSVVAVAAVVYGRAKALEINGDRE